MKADHSLPEVVDPNSPLGKAVATDVAEFLADIDQRIAADAAALTARTPA